jgi:hypothetical protein
MPHERVGAENRNSRHGWNALRPDFAAIFQDINSLYPILFRMFTPGQVEDVFVPLEYALRFHSVKDYSRIVQQSDPRSCRSNQTVAAGDNAHRTDIVCNDLMPLGMECGGSGRFP